MSGSDALLDLLILILVSLIPALVYLSWVRRAERYQAEAWGGLLRAFVYGAVVATVVAAILEVVLVEAGTAFSKAYPAPEFTFLNGNSTAGAFFLVLVIAPFIEEALKASGVAYFSNLLRGVSDGPVFGAAVGLGFGFFETFLYGLGAYLVGGLVAGLFLIAIRSVSSVLLHGSSTAMFGYGYARSRFQHEGWASGAYYLLAVLMHSTFNVLASLGAIVALFGVSASISDAASVFALFVAILFAFEAIEHVRGVIATNEYPGLAPPPRQRVAVRTRPPGAS